MTAWNQNSHYLIAKLQTFQDMKDIIQKSFYKNMARYLSAHTIQNIDNTKCKTNPSLRNHNKFNFITTRFTLLTFRLQQCHSLQLKLPINIIHKTSILQQNENKRIKRVNNKRVLNKSFLDDVKLQDKTRYI